MKRIIFPIIMIILVAFAPGKFKDNQKKYKRVRTAYAEKEVLFNNLLKENNIQKQNLNIFIRIFKEEKQLELWGKNNEDSSYKLLKSYDVCSTSGELGPKRKEGDMQIPEGFYHIDAYNPASSFYLSMRINYPNISDKILSNKKSPGSNICIHGNCVTIGCIPITDDLIKEVYLFCIEAKDNGQKSIPVSIFPAKLSDEKLKELKKENAKQMDKLNLWKDLKKAYDLFEEKKQLPTIQFLSDGRHQIK